jgi:hypothetical protein
VFFGAKSEENGKKDFARKKFLRKDYVKNYVRLLSRCIITRQEREKNERENKSSGLEFSFLNFFL